MVLLACGSRSISSVLKPLEATAADRLMAVVVLPTPPFWLATVMIMNCLGFYTVGAVREEGFVIRESFAGTSTSAASDDLDLSHSGQTGDPVVSEHAVLL